MAKFVYRMQNILDIKLKLESQAKITYSLAAQQHAQEQQKLQDFLPVEPATKVLRRRLLVHALGGHSPEGALLLDDAGVAADLLQVEGDAVGGQPVGGDGFGQVLLLPALRHVGPGVSPQIFVVALGRGGLPLRRRLLGLIGLQGLVDLVGLRQHLPHVFPVGGHGQKAGAVPEDFRLDLNLLPVEFPAIPPELGHGQGLGQQLLRLDRIRLLGLLGIVAQKALVALLAGGVDFLGGAGLEPLAVGLGPLLLQIGLVDVEDLDPIVLRFLPGLLGQVAPDGLLLLLRDGRISLLRARLPGVVQDLLHLLALLEVPLPPEPVKGIQLRVPVDEVVSGGGPVVGVVPGEVFQLRAQALQNPLRPLRVAGVHGLRQALDPHLQAGAAESQVAEVGGPGGAFVPLVQELDLRVKLLRLLLIQGVVPIPLVFLAISGVDGIEKVLEGLVIRAVLFSHAQGILGGQVESHLPQAGVLGQNEGRSFRSWRHNDLFLSASPGQQAPPGLSLAVL